MSRGQLGSRRLEEAPLRDFCAVSIIENQGYSTLLLPTLSHGWFSCSAKHFAQLKHFRKTTNFRQLFKV